MTAAECKQEVTRRANKGVTSSVGKHVLGSVSIVILVSGELTPQGEKSRGKLLWALRILIVLWLFQEGPLCETNSSFPQVSSHCVRDRQGGDSVCGLRELRVGVAAYFIIVPICAARTLWLFSSSVKWGQGKNDLFHWIIVRIKWDCCLVSPSLLVGVGFCWNKHYPRPPQDEEI